MTAPDWDERAREIAWRWAGGRQNLDGWVRAFAGEIATALRSAFTAGLAEREAPPAQAERDGWPQDEAEACAALAKLVDANELEANTIARLGHMIWHGYKLIDIIVRRDGSDQRFQADWLWRLYRRTSPSPDPKKGDAE